MIKITSTKDVAGNGVKILAYGPAGIGKTVLCSTAPKPLIISAEAGLLSLAEIDIDAIEISTVQQVQEAYQYVTEAEEAKKYETICLDSLTEIAEVLLIQYKSEEKDPRQAYGRLNDDVATTIRQFRDIKDKNIYFTAKQQRFADDDMGITRYMPGMPGKTLLNSLSYFFDEVFAMRIGQLEDSSTYRYLQTYPDVNFDCKDRSGKLPPKQKPDLTDVFERILGKEETEQEVEATERVKDDVPF